MDREFLSLIKTLSYRPNPPILLTLEETPMFMILQDLKERILEAEYQPNIYPGPAYRPINEYCMKRRKIKHFYIIRSYRK